MVERLFKKGLVVGIILLFIGLAVGIILLFIGLAVAPSINANDSIIPVKSKLVDTSIKIYRDGGITPFTVRLTERESKEIDVIFDNLKVSLDSAVTGEEIDAIYDNAVESLYKLGMFPRMTLKEAKQLVNGKSKSQSGNLGNADENFNCSIAGQTTEAFMFDLANSLNNRILKFIRSFLGMFFIYGYNFRFYEGEIGTISFGSFESYYNVYYPSKGWVHTDGSNGVVKWEGEFYGRLEPRYFHGFSYDIQTFVFTGVTNFNGLWINRWFRPPCYLGNAEHVRISNNEPPPPWPP
jgi:hypothetical protein